MNDQITIFNPIQSFIAPPIIVREGERTSERFFEFFTANISNDNTRLAYARAVTRFLDWCERSSVGLREIKPIMIAAY